MSKTPRIRGVWRGVVKTAERRMFAKTIIDSDAFLDMPLSTQALYFHLSMRADDEGFVNNPKKLQRMVGSSDDDLKVLIAKKFIIPFDTGVIVVKHWRMHNYIQNDRFKNTVYQDERSLLEIKNNKSYSLMDGCIQNGYIVDTQNSIVKKRLEENSINNMDDSDNNDKRKNEPKSKKKRKKDGVRHKHGEYQHVMLTDAEYKSLIDDYGEQSVLSGIKNVDEYCQEHGKTYHDYNLTLRKWGIKAPKKPKLKKPEPEKFEENLEKAISLADDMSNLTEYEEDQDKHPFNQGWRINNNGCWIKR